jgi:hypothetical protein
VLCVKMQQNSNDQWGEQWRSIVTCVHLSAIRMTSSAPVGKVAPSINFVSITDGPIRAIRPLPVSGRICVTYYTNNSKIRFIRCVRMDAYHSTCAKTVLTPFSRWNRYSSCIIHIKHLLFIFMLASYSSTISDHNFDEYFMSLGFFACFSDRIDLPFDSVVDISNDVRKRFETWKISEYYQKYWFTCKSTWDCR